MSRLEELVVSEFELLEKEASSQSTNALRLEELSRHPDPSVQLAVAGNLNSPSAALEYLGRSRRLGLLRALARNPNTPPHLIERLARHRHDTVRHAVAESAQISETTALEMLNDASGHTQWLLLEHSDRFQWDTARLFERAAQDSCDYVRWVVAQRATASGVLEELLDDSDPAVVVYALCNHALALSALTAKLETAFEALDLLGYWFDPSDIVRRRDLPAHWLERFSTHPIAMVRLCIVKNPNTPRSVLLGLTDDPDVTVMMGMSTLPDLTEELYLGFAKHAHPWVRSTLVKNPAIPKSVLELLARDQDPDTARRASKRLESDT